MTNRHFQTDWHRIRRAPYQTLAAISIMTMTLFLASVFFILAAGSQAILNYFETRPQVNAYFRQDYLPTSQEIASITASLQNSGKTASVVYVSKDDALKSYKDLNKSDPLLLEAVTANMLPASIEVSAKNPEDLKPLAEILKKTPNIDDVRFAEDIVSSLTKWTSSVRVIGASLVGANIFVTFIIILLIIGIKVSNRRDEILLFQLVGATRSFIYAPFIWEGIIYGVAGAIVAWGASFILLLYSTPFLVSFLSGIPLLPPPAAFIISLLGGEILLGILVGGLGGFFAVRRFLKS
jgi:cell division transport system permease protein